MFPWLKSWGKKANAASPKKPDAMQSGAPHSAGNPRHPSDLRISILKVRQAYKSPANGPPTAARAGQSTGLLLKKCHGSGARKGSHPSVALRLSILVAKRKPTLAITPVDLNSSRILRVYE
jgi:hypothetical protein